ncbi:Prefoldin subunit-domain-containing protein [Phlebopus sp. FC_14]|nr:Prefoldin subunit-domain-containing protein [Phlebopus sp. FC_14]
MNNMRMLAEEDENDDAAEVTWEDQQRINTFSKLNTRLRGIEDKLEELRQEKEALGDLSMELELMDDDQTILYKIGESFLHLTQPRALKRLEKDQADISVQLDSLSAVAEECEKGMKELKITLYAKFGRAINLDE